MSIIPYFEGNNHIHDINLSINFRLTAVGFCSGCVMGSLQGEQVHKERE